MTNFCLSNKCLNLLVKQVVWKYLKHFYFEYKNTINKHGTTEHAHTYTQLLTSVRHFVIKCKDLKVEENFPVVSFSFCSFGYSFLKINEEFLLIVCTDRDNGV